MAVTRAVAEEPARSRGSFVPRGTSFLRASSAWVSLLLLLLAAPAVSQATMMPLGICVMRTAESVVLMCWPPAPDAR